MKSHHKNILLKHNLGNSGRTSGVAQQGSPLLILPCNQSFLSSWMLYGGKEEMSLLVHIHNGLMHLL